MRVVNFNLTDRIGRKYRRNLNNFHMATRCTEACRRDEEVRSQSDHRRKLQSERQTEKESEFESDEHSCW